MQRIETSHDHLGDDICVVFDLGADAAGRVGVVLNLDPHGHRAGQECAALVLAEQAA